MLVNLNLLFSTKVKDLSVIFTLLILLPSYHLNKNSNHKDLLLVLILLDTILSYNKLKKDIKVNWPKLNLLLTDFKNYKIKLKDTKFLSVPLITKNYPLMTLTIKKT